MRTVSTLLLGFRDGNSFSRLAFDDLTNLPYETCLITFIHPTKWEQSIHLTTKLISNKTRIDPVARDGLLISRILSAGLLSAGAAGRKLLVVSLCWMRLIC